MNRFPVVALLLLTVAVAADQSAQYVNSELPWHSAVLDTQGKLLAWHSPEKNLGYDKVLRLGWDFIEHKVPLDTRHGTGLKIYLVNSSFDGPMLQGRNNMHNPAMVFASFVDSLVGWYPYSGDEEAIRVVRDMLDYQLAHGTTPANWKWSGVPFATSCGNATNYGGCLPDMPRDFCEGIETDKVGELGVGYAQFYQMTEQKRYLDAAIRCGDALACHVRAGDAEHTPWAFRVNARTGATLGQSEYGGDFASCVRLLDELIRLGAGNTTNYRTARTTAWNWILQHPLNRASEAWNKWSGFYEDVAYNTQSVNQMLPTMTAFYILSRSDPAAVDPQWRSHVGQMIDWVRDRFGRGPFFGAWGIDEQGKPDGRGCCSRAGLGSHTGRWAAINAIYAQLTGDGQAREDAIRSLNYATYFADDEGRVSCCGVTYHNPYWFSDGYSDYLRNFTWAIGALPELAPVGQNHLLRSSSVVQKVGYGTNSISYKTFDSNATEVLRLAFTPKGIVAGGIELKLREDLKEDGFTLQALAGGDSILRVRHQNARAIAIQ